MIVISTQTEPMRASLRRRCMEAQQLLELCQELLSQPSIQRGDSRRSLVLRLLELAMICYLDGMKAEGIEPSKPAVIPQLKPAQLDLEQLYLRCATLRDETWACQRMANDISSTLAYFLERQALQLEPLLRALEYADHPRETQYATG